MHPAYDVKTFGLNKEFWSVWRKHLFVVTGQQGRRRKVRVSVWCEPARDGVIICEYTLVM